MDRSNLRHRDASGRVTIIDREDAAQERYIRPSDGRLAPLVVQGADEEELASGAKEWTGSGKIRKQISPILDLVHWTYASVFKEGSEERHYDAKSTASLLLKWLPSCILLVSLLMIPQDLEGSQSNGGYYDPIRYRDWGYSKVSRNTAEDRSVKLDETEEPQEDEPLLSDDVEMTTISHPSQSTERTAALEHEMDEAFDDLPARQFRPRYLCFLKQEPNAGITYETRMVTDWIEEHGGNADTDFIFLSYTRKQFCVGTEQEIAKWDLPDEGTRAAYTSIASHDRTTLLQYGVQAALSASKPAFWLDFECIRDADNQAKAQSQSEDVYRICDIVRAAHSLVILVGPPLTSRLPNGMAQEYNPSNASSWLHEWGTRLWTLPEILLCSPEHRVKLYAIGGPREPERLAKRNFAARGAWKDAKLVRQLVDHYESSVHLTPLELVSIALECFAARQTDQFNRGDVAYALMGLLRRRPPVNKADTGFEAFARLSLANDSDALLERLLCMLPPPPPPRRGADAAAWHEIRDAWGARLWDIEPRCQVAAIVDDETVMLDGAFGATIQWDGVEQVAFFKRPTLARAFGKVLLRGLPAYLITALVLTITGGIYLAKYNDQKREYEASQHNDDDDDPYSSPGVDEGPSASLKSAALGLLIPGLVILVPAALITLCAPAMLLDIYRGKFWSTQARFVGIEGMVDVGEAERHLFGFNHGRLKWSTSGSMLSRHRYVDGECVPMPPALESSADDAGPGRTVFTLVDTYAMTATCFYAERPPVAVILCGQEGGMQRAVLCSYDWRTQTFARETVLRMKTLVLDRMFRVDRFRFALRRRRNADDGGQRGLAGAAGSEGGSSSGHTRKIWPMWKVDLLLLPLMWFINGALQSGPRTWSDYLGVRAIAAYAGMLVALKPAVYMMRRVQTGHSIALATFIWSALNIGYNFTYSHSRAGIITLLLLMGMTCAFMVPAFVFLTGAWYTSEEQIFRILVWGYGSLFLRSLCRYVLEWAPGYHYWPELESIGLYDSRNIESLVVSVIFMFLAGFAYFFIRTPDQAGWLSAQERIRFRSRQMEWKSTAWKNIQTTKLLRDPQIWLFFGISLLNKAYISAGRLRPVERNDSVEWAVIVSSIVLALIIGATLTRSHNFRILTMGLIITLGYAASITLCVRILDYKKTNQDDDFYGNGMGQSLAAILTFMMRIGRMVQYLIWSLCLSNTHDITSRLTTIFASFTGWAAGGIIGGIYWKAVLGKHDENENWLPLYTPIHGHIALTSVLYGLQVLVLIAWCFYYWRANRKFAGGKAYGRAPVPERRGMLGSAGVPEGRESFRFYT